MTDLDIAELRRLLTEATPRPWQALGPTFDTIVDGAKHFHGSSSLEAGLKRAVVNCALIVAAVNALPALLDIADKFQNGGGSNTGRQASDNATPAPGSPGPERARQLALAAIWQALSGDSKLDKDTRINLALAFDALRGPERAQPASEEMEALSSYLDFLAEVSGDLKLEKAADLLRRPAPRQSEGK